MVHDYPPVSGGGLAIASQELATLFGWRYRFRIMTSRLADHFSDDRPGVHGRPRHRRAPQTTRASPLRLLMETARADTLVVHWTFSFRWLSTCYLLLGPLSGRPTICVVHTAPDHWQYNRMRRLPRFLRTVLFGFVRFGLARCTAVVALSASHAAALAQTRLPATHILPLPVRPSQAHLSAFRSDRRLLPARRVGFAGELSRLKGADDLLALLGPLTPAWSFDVAGNGPLRARLLAEVGALSPNQRSRIRLRGHLPPAWMDQFYRDIDFLLVPSRTESQCRVALEAMLSGVIVLARPTLGIADIVVHGETGFLIDPADADDVSHCLRRAARDHTGSAAIRDRARAVALRHFRTSRRGWRALLRDVTASGGGA